MRIILIPLFGSENKGRITYMIFLIGYRFYHGERIFAQIFNIYSPVYKP